MAASTSSHASTYHVFLSFRGQDTRHGFTGHLYKALTDKGIHTFIDDEELQRGEEITPALFKAIHESKIAIVVLSKDYASSRFCLDELATIICCAQSKGLLVIPVFYMVDPSDVRHLRGSYGDALAKHEKRLKHNMDKLQKWKQALRQVADLSGYHFKQGDAYEYKFIGSIVDWVSQKIKHPARLHVADHPVGLESRVKEVMELLDVGSDDAVHMVGIHGMGGVGKSTLARAVYNDLISLNFGGLCFLENVREESNKHGLQHLQSILLEEVLKDESIKITSWRQGASIIEDRLKGKKVLLVLDDVDKHEQLQSILGRPYWFGPGSRVIITTRDVELLKCHDVQNRYEVNEMNEDDALQLLTWKAFKKEKADPTHVDVLNRVLTYASGLPLVLEVIGSHLFGISIERWESAIDYYERNPDKGIQGILEVSIMALQDGLKSVFLDIACFLKGYELEKVEYILSALYDHDMKYTIGLLVEKSLIKVDHGIVKMHDLIQDMGRQIELEKSHKKRKRLWFWKDIIEVLKHNKGTSKIEIIYLDVPISDREEIIEWDGNGFKKMENLKILIIKNAKFFKAPKCLPNSLRVLEWCEYPSNCLPSGFEPHKFVMCELPYSRFSSFELNSSSKMFKNLTVLKFDECMSLTEIPDLSGFSNLEELSFEYCDNLVKIHESIGRLGKVKAISARGCRNLVSFPPIHLTSLGELHLSGTGLESFPEISGKMENIRRLCWTETPIKEFPISFVNLIGLQDLCMELNRSVVKLPVNILMMPELIDIRATYCKGVKWVKEEEIEETMGSIICSNVECLNLASNNLDDDFFSEGFTRFAHVKELYLSGNDFTFLPECIKEFQSLRILFVRDCKRLEEIRGVPPNIEEFDALNCISLTSSSTSMFKNKELYEAGMRKCNLPEAWIPEWFDHQESRGNERSISLWFRNKMPTNILFLLIAPLTWCHSLRVYINGKNFKRYYLFLEVYQTEMDQTFIVKLDLEWMWHLYPYKVVLEKEWNHMEIRYEGEIETSAIKAMRIHILDQEKDDIRFADPCRKRKLDDYLYNFESDKKRLVKRCRLVDMEFEQQQKCIVSCLLKWASSCFPTQFMVIYIGVLLYFFFTYAFKFL